MIIKCPECGRQVSDKAPTCPTCGVQIAGKITRCQNCGEIYFTSEGMCPNCHETANAGYRPSATSQPAATTSQPAGAAIPTPKDPVSTQKHDRPQQPEESGQPQPKKKNNATLIVAFVFAILVCGSLFWLYNNSKSEKENEEYEFAMRSTDPEVLQSYLLRYGDAPQEHRDSIQAHLLKIQKGDEDWQNAILSNSRSALQKYIDENPESIHKQEALNKIDSLDWITAQNSNDPEVVKDYQANHPSGRYIDEADILLSKLISTLVQPDEKQMIASTFRQFFQSINSRDESRLSSTVSMVLDNFLGKSNATSEDVISFLHKLYKEGVSNMNWHIDQSSYNIKKQEIAENEYEYTVSFNARQEIERGENVDNVTYRVSAKVTNDGKISDFNLTRIN